MEIALASAHDVEVGDTYFQDQRYEAAMERYKDAVQQKPEDAAVHVRLGRALEKLNRLPDAMAQYQAAQKLSGPEKWTKEAAASLERLQRRNR